jgi:hypothetical protein
MSITVRALYNTSGSINVVASDNITITVPSNVVRNTTAVIPVYITGPEGPAGADGQDGAADIPPGTITGSDQLTSSLDLRYELQGTGIVSGSSQLTGSYDVRYVLSGSVQPLPDGLISGSEQLPSGLISGSEQLPSGLISGSSQLNSTIINDITIYELTSSLIHATSSNFQITNNIGNQLFNMATGDGSLVIGGNVSGVTSLAQFHVEGDGYIRDDFEINRNLTVSGSVSSSNVFTDYIQFDTTSETSLEAQGALSWNVDELTLDLVQNGTVLQIGQEIQYNVRNDSGNLIADGTPVMATGTIGASGRITIGLMDGTNSNNVKYFLGLTTETILDGEDGKVTSFGKVRGIDTSDWNDGDILWISGSANGELTNIEPLQPIMGMPVAFVVHSGLNGTIFVRVNNLNQHEFIRTTEDSSVSASIDVTGSIRATSFTGSFRSTDNFLPDTTDTHDLGSPTNRWRDLYLSGSTIYLGSTIITGNPESGVNVTGISNISGSFSGEGSLLTFGGTNIVSGSSQIIYNDISNIPGGIISSSNQITSQLPSGVISGSSQLPSGIISGSSQLTTEFDTRYLNTGGDGVISGSSQLTTDFDTRYLNTNSDNVITGSAQVSHDFTTGFETDEHVAHTTVLITAGSGLTGGGNIASSRTIDVGQGDGITVGATTIAVDSTVLRTSGGTVSGNLIITGDLAVNGTTTTVSTENLLVKDNTIEINYGGIATEGGILVRDITGGSTISGSLLWDGTNDYWKAGTLGNESKILLANGDGVISGSSQLTSSYDSRYVLDSNYQTDSASFDSLKMSHHN